MCTATGNINCVEFETFGNGGYRDTPVDIKYRACWFDGSTSEVIVRNVYDVSRWLDNMQMYRIPGMRSYEVLSVEDARQLLQ